MEGYALPFIYCMVSNLRTRSILVTHGHVHQITTFHIMWLSCEFFCELADIKLILNWVLGLAPGVWVSDSGCLGVWGWLWVSGSGSGCLGLAPGVWGWFPVSGCLSLAMGVCIWLRVSGCPSLVPGVWVWLWVSGSGFRGLAPDVYIVLI
jgi:hypothetical protein